MKWRELLNELRVEGGQDLELDLEDLDVDSDDEEVQIGYGEDLDESSLFTAIDDPRDQDAVNRLAELWGYRSGPDGDHQRFEDETHKTSAGRRLQLWTDTLFRAIEQKRLGPGDELLMFRRREMRPADRAGWTNLVRRFLNSDEDAARGVAALANLAFLQVDTIVERAVIATARSLLLIADERYDAAMAISDAFVDGHPGNAQRYTRRVLVHTARRQLTSTYRHYVRLMVQSALRSSGAPVRCSPLRHDPEDPRYLSVPVVGKLDIDQVKRASELMRNQAEPSDISIVGLASSARV